MGAPSAMVSFYPDIPEVEASKACGEFVFLMDRSGSMELSMNNQNSQLRIEAAKVKPESSLFIVQQCHVRMVGKGMCMVKS